MLGVAHVEAEDIDAYYMYVFLDMEKAFVLR